MSTVRVFDDDEISALRSHVEGREDQIERILSQEDIELLSQRNYQNPLW